MASFINALPGAVAQGLIWGIMAIGVYITFRILDIADLTVDGSICTGAAVCIMLMQGKLSSFVMISCIGLAFIITAGGVFLYINNKKSNVVIATFGAIVAGAIAGGLIYLLFMLSPNNIYVDMLLSFLAGMLAGLVTGILHTFMGIPAILAGILTQLSLYSANLIIMGKANQPINVDKFNLLISLRNISGVAIYKNPILIVSVITIVCILILYWFFGTELGCSIRATGCNDKMARAQGINTDFNRVLGLMISNGMVAFAGALLCQYQGFADINMGRGSIVIGLAAVIIGEFVFSKIFHNFGFRLLGVALGSVIYYVFLQFLLSCKFDPNYLKMLQAGLVAIFLALPYLINKYFPKAVKKNSDKGGRS